MLLSNLLPGHKTPPPRFAPGLFLGLLFLFVLIGQARPNIALAGMGTTLIITAVLVELNRKRIWEEYLQRYKKRKGLNGFWAKPNHVYYSINVRVLWPFILFLGFMCLYAAYLLD